MLPRGSPRQESQKPVPLDASVFRTELNRLRSDGESADYVLDALGETFTLAELEKRLILLQRQLATRRQDGSIVSVIRQIAERKYAIHFSSETSLAERVLCRPWAPSATVWRTPASSASAP